MSELEHISIWAMFRAASPLTNKFLSADVNLPLRECLLEKGYVKDVGQPKWAEKAGLTGWRIFEVTETGHAAIKGRFNRSIALKPTLAGLQDSFTDGVIK